MNLSLFSNTSKDFLTNFNISPLSMIEYITVETLQNSIAVNATHVFKDLEQTLNSGDHKETLNLKQSTKTSFFPLSSKKSENDFYLLKNQLSRLGKINENYLRIQSELKIQTSFIQKKAVNINQMKAQGESIFGDVNKLDGLGNSLLHKACKVGNANTVEALVKLGADINLKNVFDSTPLAEAIKHRKLEVIEKLVNLGAKVDLFRDSLFSGLFDFGKIEFFNPRNVNYQENLQILKILLKGGNRVAYFSPQPKDSSEIIFKRSFLHNICDLERVDIIEILAKEGKADFNEKNWLGHPPLSMAILTKKINVVKALIKAGADIGSIGGFPLHQAAETKNFEIVEILVNEGNADINLKDASGSTPLHKAVRSENLTMIQSLIALGADCNIQDNNGQTPLFLAAALFKPFIISALLEAGALTMIVDNQGKNPLLACQILNESVYSNYCKDLLGDDAYSKKFLLLKDLSHIFEIAGKGYFSGDVNTYIMDLEGGFSKQFAHSFTNYVAEFSKNYPNRISQKEASRITTLLEESGRWEHFNLFRMIDKIKKGKKILINTGFHGHSISILFQGDYLIIGNKGAETRQPIEIFKINKEKITKDLLQEIMNLRDKSRDDYKKWLENIENTFETTPHDRLAKFIEGNYPFEDLQIMGNCAWESLKTGIYGSFVLERLKDYDFNTGDWAAYEKTIKNANDDFAILQQFFKVSALEKVMKNRQPGDDQIILNAFWKSWRIPKWEEGLAEKIEDLERQYLSTLPQKDLLRFKNLKKFFKQKI